MDEIYVTYVDDEHVDNHDYDDTTDDEHDNNNDIYVSGLDQAGPGPDPGRTGPNQARPSQTSPKYTIFSQNIESTVVYNPG